MESPTRPGEDITSPSRLQSPHVLEPTVSTLPPVATFTPAKTPLNRRPLRNMDINSLLSSPQTDLYVKPPASFNSLKRSHSQFEQEEEHKADENGLRQTPHHIQSYNPSPTHLAILPHLSGTNRPLTAPSTPFETNLTLPPIQNLGTTQLSNHVPTQLPHFQVHKEVHRPEHIPYTCDEIRERIRHYLESGEMRVTHFQRTLNINSNSYGRFMRLSGPESGIDNQTYVAAVDFFAFRDQARTGAIRTPIPIPDNRRITPMTSNWNHHGITPVANSTMSNIGLTTHPTKRARTNTVTSITSSSRDSPHSSTSTPTTSSSLINTTSATPLDVSDITVSGLHTDTVPVYDSCDEIRQKISFHLSRPGVTQASFLRTLAAQFFTEERKFQSKQLNTFRGYRGADKGNTSAIFYASYVYFERLRIKDGQEKSAHRLEMEAVWPNGFEVKTPGPSQRGLFTGPGESWHVDSLGRYVFPDGRMGTW